MKYLLLVLALFVSSCARDADVASHNLSVAADNFEIYRRVVFYNGITGEYILTVEGLCSLGNHDAHGEVTITCKTGPRAFKKHFLGLSQNVTYFAEQIDQADASTYHYRVIFKPTSIVPSLEVK